MFTDHRPLLGIFNKGLPAVIATRLQRYLVRASIFDFDLRYRKGKFNVLADFGSRNPGGDEKSLADAVEDLYGYGKRRFDYGKVSVGYG